MKTSHFTAPCRPALLVVAALMCTPGEVSAVELSTYVSKPSQWGTGSGFYHGHTVTAGTPFNILNAGGAFTVQCNHPATLMMTGERSYGRTTAGRVKNMFTVTIPERHPAVRNVSGWMQIPGDTTFTCAYRWTSFATEGGYSISAGGFGITYGNETKRDGNTIDFEMYRPPKEDADGGCIP